jgi:hypothetical protein
MTCIDLPVSITKKVLSLCHRRGGCMDEITTYHLKKLGDVLVCGRPLSALFSLILCSPSGYAHANTCIMYVYMFWYLQCTYVYIYIVCIITHIWLCISYVIGMYSCTYVNKYIEFHAPISGFPSQLFFGASDRAPAMVLPGGSLVASLFAETVDPKWCGQRAPILVQLPIYPELFKGTEQMFDEALFIQCSWSLVNKEGNLLMFNQWWWTAEENVHSPSSPNKGGIHFAPISGTAARMPEKKKALVLRGSCF